MLHLMTRLKLRTRIPLESFRLIYRTFTAKRRKERFSSNNSLTSHLARFMLRARARFDLPKKESEKIKRKSLDLLRAICSFNA